jgi:hypothetical protein
MPFTQPYGRVTVAHVQASRLKVIVPLSIERISNTRPPAAMLVAFSYGRGTVMYVQGKFCGARAAGKL